MKNMTEEEMNEEMFNNSEVYEVVHTAESLKGLSKKELKKRVIVLSKMVEDITYLSEDYKRQLDELREGIEFPVERLETLEETVELLRKGVNNLNKAARHDDL